MDARTIGRVTLEAAFVGVVAGVAYAAMRHLGAPLCPPTAVSCAAEAGGALFAVQLGGVATALALPVLALRAGLGWTFAVVATAGIVAVNAVWFLTMSDMWTVLR
jgi:Na+-transporting NADH:ubiquinone oxidoreductase subunit NqrE